MSGIYPYAGFWRRFAAFIIDSIIISIPTTVVYMWWMWRGAQNLIQLIPAGADPAEMSPEALQALLGMYGGVFGIQILGLLIFWLYFSWMESSSWQATLGKKALGIKAVDSNGQRMTFWHATGRNLGKIISGMTLYIGFLIAGATKRKQALHDIIASAYVVREAYEPGQELPEVQTHFGLLALSIIALLVAFLLPFVLLGALAVAAIQQEANNAPALDLQQTPPQITQPAAADTADIDAF